MSLEEYWVIQNRNGKFFKLDAGGYPAFITDCHSGQKYKSREFAEQFLNEDYATRMFKNEFAGSTVKKVEVLTLIKDTDNVDNNAEMIAQVKVIQVLNDLINVILEWGASTNVISCDTLIELIQMKKTNIEKGREKIS